VPLELLLRICFLPLWLNLSDPVVEEAMYGSDATRSLVAINLGP
jgi:IS5 family transposase